MANQSKKLKEGFQNLPENIADFLETPLPLAPSISTPNDIDSAIIAQGILSKYILDVFRPLEGFSIAAALMHIGQLNAVNQAMALASLQIREGYAAIEIILPSASVNYSAGSPFIAEIAITVAAEDVSLQRVNPDGSSLVTAMLSGPEAVAFEILTADDITEGHYYIDQVLHNPGEYIYSFSATVGGHAIDSDLLTITVI